MMPAAIRKRLDGQLMQAREIVVTLSRQLRRPYLRLPAVSRSCHQREILSTLSAKLSWNHVQTLNSVESFPFAFLIGVNDV